MRTERYTRVVLTLAAVFLGIIAARPYLAPAPVHAQQQSPDPGTLFVEPGVHPIRMAERASEIPGKIVIDLRNGNVWGFPTGDRLPYPVTMGKEPPVSKPVYLGKFDLAALNERQ